MICKRKVILWTLLIGWMFLIGWMSNQPAVVSDSQSQGIISVLETIGIDMNSLFGELSNFLIRKCAHFLEYMILGILLYNVLLLYFTNKKLILLSILLCMTYAISDEIHQFFVPGRECALRDVIIDTLGSSFGIIISKYLFNTKKSVIN